VSNTRVAVLFSVFAEVVSKFVRTPLFALQSIVDHDQIGNLPKGGGRCCDNCTSQQRVNDFARRLNTALHDGLFSGPYARAHGGFIDTVSTSAMLRAEYIVLC
jgi:hypothetical protein